MTVARHRTVIRGREDLRRRRQDLFRAASPAFRAFGYRQVTLKVLGRACGLSIPGLYRYFPSKRDFAAYPLSPENRPGAACFDASSDVLGHLRIWIEHGAVERPDFLLAYSLVQQMDDHERPSRDELRECFAFHEDLLSTFMRRAAEGLSATDATAVAQAMLAASFGRDVILVEPSVEEMRAEFIRLARAALIPAGVDAQRFDRVMAAPPPPHECPAFCEG